jgi:hypothetical protein
MPPVAEHVREPATTRNRGALAVVILAFFYALFNAYLFAADWSNDDAETLLFALVGCCAIQPVLIGLWTALGPGAFMLRVPFALNILVCVVLATGLFPVYEPGSPSSDARFAVWLLAAGAFIYGMATILGGIIRWWSRQSIQLVGESRSSSSPFRFSVKYVLSLTTVTAVSLAIAGKVLSSFPEPVNATQWFPMPETAVFSAVVFAICLPTTVGSWAVLSGARRLPLVILGILFWFLWTTVILVVLKAVLKPPETFLPYSNLIVLQFGALAWGLGSALVLYAFGFRLVTRGHGSMSGRSQRDVPADSSNDS